MRKDKPLQHVVLRPATTGDLDLLWRALAMAAREETVEDAMKIATVAKHLKDWRRPTDFGFIAADPSGAFLGAAWARQFAPREKPAVFLNATTPEVSIGVVPEARSQGLGKRLLGSLVAEAAKRRVNLCLNVRETNPAMRLYEQLGFRCIEGSNFLNRTGGFSRGMVRECIAGVPTRT